MLGRVIKVGIGENDRGVLPAKLELHLLSVLDCRLLQLAPDIVRPGEAHRRHTWMRHEHVADLCPAS